jgi:ribonuclease E
MVERPIEDEPAIAETEPAEEPQPVPSKVEGPKGRRARKTPPAAAEITPSEPTPAKAPPAKTADEAQPEPKPRRGRAKKAVAGEAEPAASAEPAPPPPANNDTAEDSANEPRRSGWWQRTFG